VSVPATLSGREPAHAKVNLGLHVIGRRHDGYHELDSLVAFPPFGDDVAAEAAAATTLVIDGPFAAGLADDGGNLVLAAARLLAERHPHNARDVRLTLTKRLPVAAGLGGGSADAAATLRLLDRLWGLGLGLDELTRLARPLGSDVPMCVRSATARTRGTGERLDPVPPLPPLGLVLANPRVPVATPEVFRALARRANPPLPPLPAAWRDAADLAAWLAGCRNDLEPAARAVAPAIGPLLDALAGLPGARLARLSGSGATAFALFDRPSDAAAAARRLAAAEPGWWIVATELGDGAGAKGDRHPVSSHPAPP
jgi:4-diphosphocytidyl-2-C-methyl-D-erythritol kinase